MNETYKKNLQLLEKFVMVQFLNDTVVDPRVTEVGAFVHVHVTHVLHVPVQKGADCLVIFLIKKKIFDPHLVVSTCGNNL